jgi:hypothetical protein
MKKRSRIYLSEEDQEIEEIGELNENVPTRVRRCIIGAGGLVGIEPTIEDMPNEAELKRNYHFTNKHFDSLFSRLARLIRSLNEGAIVYTTEVKKCEKVSDCIKLVEDKTKLPV